LCAPPPTTLSLISLADEAAVAKLAAESMDGWILKLLLFLKSKTTGLWLIGPASLGLVLSKASKSPFTYSNVILFD
jgi:hypothetical protein